MIRLTAGSPLLNAPLYFAPSTINHHLLRSANGSLPPPEAPAPLPLPLLLLLPLPLPACGFCPCGAGVEAPDEFGTEDGPPEAMGSWSAPQPPSWELVVEAGLLVLDASKRSLGRPPGAVAVPFPAAAAEDAEAAAADGASPNVREAKSSRTEADEEAPPGAAAFDESSSSSNEMRSVILAVGTASAPPFFGSIL